MKSVRWLISYIFVAVLGLWLAFAVSAKFMAPAHSQNALSAPSSGELPPEFMKEAESQQAPSKTQISPPPAVPPPPPPPPPLGGEVPVGDSVTAVEPTHDLLPQEEYKYDPTGKRDPFKVFHAIRVTRPEANKIAAREITDPLQRWEIDRLQVVGILWDVHVPRAMIRDPDGALYTVTKNSKIGRNEGFVAAIREGEVVVVEVKYDEGQSIKETRVMELKK